MLKIIETALSLFLGNYLSQSSSTAKPPTVLVMEFLQSKSRYLFLALVACISLAILFSSGVVIAIYGGSQWANSGDLNPEAIGTAQFLVFSGVALILATAITSIVLFVRAKPVIELQPESRPEPEHPIKTAFLGILKDFIQEAAANQAARKQAENDHSKQTSTSPESNRVNPSDIGITH
jgi:hypothetical protein